MDGRLTDVLFDVETGLFVLLLLVIFGEDRGDLGDIVSGAFAVVDSVCSQLSQLNPCQLVSKLFRGS